MNRYNVYVYIYSIYVTARLRRFPPRPMRRRKSPHWAPFKGRTILCAKPLYKDTGSNDLTTFHRGFVWRFTGFKMIWRYLKDLQEDFNQVGNSWSLFREKICCHMCLNIHDNPDYKKIGRLWQSVERPQRLQGARQHGLP